MISYNEAYQLTIKHIQVLGEEEVALISAVDRITASNLTGRVDSPSADVSLKDGYAVHSNDIVKASDDTPVTLRLTGKVAAGGTWQGWIGSGEAVRVLSGAPIPDGADAVISEEFTQLSNEMLLVTNDAHLGRNILAKGSDVSNGELLVEKGVRLNPPTVGLLAAAGFQFIPVVRLPRVAILATGDEVIAPGDPMRPGNLYASNLVTLAAWCVRYGFTVETFIARDDEVAIREKLFICLHGYDAVLTSGGAWSGERDLVVRLLDELDWKKVYHRVRIGPGKAVVFGMCRGKPVFCLPGGPPSNHMAFLQLALPGLQKMSGVQEAGLPVRLLRMADSVSGQLDWTQFVHGRLEETFDLPWFYPLNPPSRLQMMSAADAIVKIPEGQELVEQGKVVAGQIMM
jgi:molybdopterin molybdotransferase